MAQLFTFEHLVKEVGLIPANCLLKPSKRRTSVNESTFIVTVAQQALDVKQYRVPFNRIVDWVGISRTVSIVLDQGASGTYSLYKVSYNEKTSTVSKVFLIHTEPATDVELSKTRDKLFMFDANTSRLSVVCALTWAPLLSGNLVNGSTSKSQTSV